MSRAHPPFKTLQTPLRDLEIVRSLRERALGARLAVTPGDELAQIGGASRLERIEQGFPFRPAHLRSAKKRQPRRRVEVRRGIPLRLCFNEHGAPYPSPVLKATPDDRQWRAKGS